MGENNQIALSEKKELTIEEIEIEINYIEKGLTLSPILFRWMSSSKQEGFQDIAELYEKKFILKPELGIKTNQVANYMVKRFTELGIKFSKTTLYDGLSSKYKLHEENPDKDDSGIRNGNSSLNTEEENKNYLEIIEEQITLYKLIKTKLLHSHFMTKLNKVEQKQVNESFLHMRTIIKITKALFDDRQSVPLHLQHLLISANIQQTNNFSMGIYVSKVKDFGANRFKKARQKMKRLAEAGLKYTKKDDTLTSKQGMKILLRKFKRILQINEPQDRNDAISIGNYGLQCPECNSWRVERTINNQTFKMEDHCHACGYDFHAKFASKCPNPECNFPFYTEVLVIMAKNAKEENGAMNCKCARCKKEVILPKPMLNDIVTPLIQRK